jgi:hypothetical protein
MSLINDICAERDELDCSNKAIRKFLAVILLVLGFLVFWLFRHDFTRLASFFAGFSAYFVFGLFKPGAMVFAYRLWMTLALVLGWLVARVVMILLFYLMLSPFGIVARLLKKSFLDTGFKADKSSYWIKKVSRKQVDYRKMF